eukprot:TRINITY_DN1973_c0_g1_i1.p1 TRINITY_DN1973_c0_g1~~TRINITY_DN1973_c0_g1_i1.p1  ORF type:complete len:882 (+),score=15.07 TRINITY_DN1973_c0_g1_i1:47-2647(+)
MNLSLDLVNSLLFSEEYQKLVDFHSKNTWSSAKEHFFSLLCSEFSKCLSLKVDHSIWKEALKRGLLLIRTVLKKGWDYNSVVASSFNTIFCTLNQICGNDTPFLNSCLQDSILAFIEVLFNDRLFFLESIVQLLVLIAQQDSNSQRVPHFFVSLMGKTDISLMVSQAAINLNEKHHLTIVNPILSIIGTKHHELLHDCPFAKSLSLFIEALCESSVHFLLTDDLLVLFSSECVSLRCSLISLLSCSIKCKISNSPEKKDTLFALLLERGKDTHSFCRVKVLNTWICLLQTGFCPVSLFIDLASLANVRITDKSSQVRRSALRLLVIIIEINPFGFDLSKQASYQEKSPSLRSYYFSRQNFVTTLKLSIATVFSTLGLRSRNETLDSLALLKLVSEASLGNVCEGKHRLLRLVWSCDAAVIQTLISVYQGFLVTKSCSNLFVNMPWLSLFIDELKNSNSMEYIAIKEMSIHLFLNNELATFTIERMWALVESCNYNSHSETTLASFKLLCFFATIDFTILSRFSHIVIQILKQNTSLLVLSVACEALTMMYGNEARPIIFSQTLIIAKLFDILKTPCSSWGKWQTFCQTAIPCLYCLLEEPVHQMTGFLSDVLASLKNQMSSTMLKQYLCIIGSISVSQLFEIYNILEYNNMHFSGQGTLICDLPFVSKHSISWINYCSKVIPLSQQLLLNVSSSESEKAVASTCFSKCILTSEGLCQQYLAVTFSLIHSDISNTVKRTLLLLICDISVRFPNIFRPWCSSLIKLLGSHSSQFREDSLIITVYLINHNIIKLRGFIARFALGLIDENARVRQLTEAFFRDIAHKQNSLYNHIPEMIYDLLENNCLPGHFRTIVTFVFNFIEKERQVK